MWSPSRLGRFWFLPVSAAMLLMAGCGFQPLYATGGVSDVSDELSQVEVGVIPNRSGQVLRNYLIQGLNSGGRPDAPVYRLNIDLRERQVDLGIDKTDTAQRANLVLTARFVLRTAADDQEVLNRRVGIITSYNIVLDEYATLSAQNAARDRALRQLGSDIRTQLALYFNRSG